MNGWIGLSVSQLVLLGGFCCVLLAVGIVLRRESRKYLRDSELLKIVSEFQEILKEMRERSKGWLRIPALATLLPFVLLMLGASLIPALYPYAEPHPLIHAEDWYIIQVPWEQPNQELWIRRKDGSEGKITFCKTFDPPFREGEYLTSIDFRNYVGCIFPEHYMGAHDPAHPENHAMYDCPSVGQKASDFKLDPHCNLPKENVNGHRS